VAADLSLLSKSEENRLDLTMELVDLGEVAAGVVAQLGPQFEAHGVAIAIERTGPLPVTGDADRLAQVFTNIVGNALEHTPEGGSVRIEARRHGDTAEVRVADTGRGIPPEMIDLVFERFFRADRTRPGTGIGLTIARRIVRLHGGFMTAESEGPGRGATFTVSIPLGGHPVSGPA
jgi:histidine kinase